MNREHWKQLHIKRENGSLQKWKQQSRPSEVVVTPYKTTMLADGKDAAVINITAVDKQGREVPDANNLITFSISGDAKIIGVGNGDPSSHEPDKIFEGCMAATFVQWKMPGDHSIW